MNPAIEAMLVVCRFLHDASAMFLWGAFGFLSTLVPSGLAHATAQRLSPARYIAVALVVLTALAMLPLKTAMIAGGWHSTFDPQTLGTVIGATSVGTAWAADALASLLLAITLVLPDGLRIRATAIAASLVLSSLVLTGHAMMHEGLIGYLQQANDIVHVLSSGAWVGALAPLVLILASFPADRVPGAHKQALDRFSVAGRAAVALIVLTGVANTWLIVGGWPINWAYPYQLLLVMKIVVTAVMIGFAGMNYLVFTPKLASTPLTGATAIKRGATGEIMLGFFAIALVSTFSMFNPGP